MFFIRDVFEGLNPGSTVRWQFMLKAKAELDGNRLVLAEKGRSLEVLCNGSDATPWQVEPAEGPKPLNSPNPGFSRAFFTLTAGAEGCVVADVSFVLAHSSCSARR